jgi:Putative peptidoglycan binding domain
VSEMHTVEQGEYLASIAKDYGFSDWHTIYDHPQNANLKKKRPNPNILLPGDEIFIPDKQPKEESCQTEKKHRFQVKVPKAWLKIVLKDAEGKPIKNQLYTLKVAWLTSTGTTDGTGLLQQKIPIGIHSGELTLDKVGLTWPLKIGYLDPIHDDGDDTAIISGLQARLNNLGFHCGAVDGVLGAKTREATRMFQTEIMGRDPDRATGEPDKETQEALKKQYGC